MGNLELIGIPAAASGVLLALGTVNLLWSWKLQAARAPVLSRAESIRLAICTVSLYTLATFAGFIAAFFAATG